MTKQKITLNSQDTPFTVDMYQTFTGEEHDDWRIEDYNEQNNTSLEYDDFDWKYDTKEILKWLSIASVEYIRDNILDDVILSVSEPSDFHSPKFYNYETDSYMATYTVDTDRLDEYLTEDNRERYEEFIGNNIEMFNSSKRDDYLLMFYLKEVVDESEYMIIMYDETVEAFLNHTEMTLKTNQ